jgi:hypothetical protein
MQENLVYSNLAKDQRDLNVDSYRNSRQTIMCSATIPQRQHFAASCMKNGWTETLPTLVHVTPDQLIPPQVFVDKPMLMQMISKQYVYDFTVDRA